MGMCQVWRRKAEWELRLDVQQGLDVQVVGSQDDLEEHLLVDRDELGVPLADVGGLLANIIVRVLHRHGLPAVVFAVLQHLIGTIIAD